MSPPAFDTQRPNWTPPLSVVVNNCGQPEAAGGDSGFLPTLSSEADQYLAESAQPFFAVPFWVWLAIGGAAFWFFWGRKHIDLETWSIK